MAGALGAGDSGPGSGKRGTRERAGGGMQNWGAALAAHGCRMRAGGGSFLAQWDGCCRRRLLRGWLCREGENEKETAYAVSLR